MAAAPRPKAVRARLVRKETAAWLLPILERGVRVLRLVVGEIKSENGAEVFEQEGMAHGESEEY